VNQYSIFFAKRQVTIHPQAKNNGLTMHHCRTFSGNSLVLIDKRMASVYNYYRQVISFYLDE